MAKANPTDDATAYLNSINTLLVSFTHAMNAKAPPPSASKTQKGPAPPPPPPPPAAAKKTSNKRNTSEPDQRQTNTNTNVESEPDTSSASPSSSPSSSANTTNNTNLEEIIPASTSLEYTVANNKNVGYMRNDDDDENNGDEDTKPSKNKKHNTKHAKRITQRTQWETDETCKITYSKPDQPPTKKCERNDLFDTSDASTRFDTEVITKKPNGSKNVIETKHSTDGIELGKQTKDTTVRIKNQTTASPPTKK
jgi:hypothetical protein